MRGTHDTSPRFRQARLAPAQIGVPRLAVGFVTNFFDTLGIGSFAPTTAFFKLRRLVPDELIPGTLNVGHALPTVAQAAIFIGTVSVAPLTLGSMIGAALLRAPCCVRPERNEPAVMGRSDGGTIGLPMARR